MSITAISQALIGVSDAKTVLRETGLDAEKQDLLQLHINGVSAYILGYTGQRKLVWEDVAIDEYRDGDGLNEIWLRCAPVRDLVSVTFYPGRDAEEAVTGPATAESNDDMIVDQRAARIVLLDRTTPMIPMAVKVSYKAGYYLRDQPSSGDPGDPEGSLLEAIAMAVIQRRWTAMIQNTVGVASRSDDSAGSISYSEEDFTKEELRLLRRFQRSMVE